MSALSRPPSRQAYVEDASDSYDDTPAGHKTRRSKSNVAVKRSSHSSDLGKQASDSGYSSRTAATKSSADSTQSSTAKAKGSPVKTPAARAPAAEAPPASKRRPSMADRRRSSQLPESLRTPLPRHGSTRERRDSVTRPVRRDSISVPCREPNCSKCLGNPKPPKPTPLDTGININYPPFTSAHPSSLHPASPSRGHLAPDYPQSAMYTETAGRRPSLYHAGRPISYHGASSLSGRYDINSQIGGGYGGPAPSLYNQHFNLAGATPPGNGFHHPFGVQPPQSPVAPPFGDRPQMMRGTTDGYNARGGAVVVQQSQQPQRRELPNPRYGPPTASMPPRGYEDDYSEEETGYFRYDPAERDRRAMPPPPLPIERPPERRPQERRPSLVGKSRTTHDILRTSRNPVDEPYDYDNEDRVSHPLAKVPSRGSSNRRQSVTSSDRTKTYYTGSTRSGNVVVETAHPDRRVRGMERDKTRRNTMYNMVVPSRTDPDALRRDAKLDAKQKDKLQSTTSKVEDYLRQTGASYGNVVDNLRTGQARPRASSHTNRSRASSGSNKDRESRVSDGARSNVTRKTNGNGDMKIRFNGEDDVNLEFLGDMSNKALRLRTGADGGQEIVIADTRQKEQRYLKDSSRVTTNTSGIRSRGDREPGRSRMSSRSEREEQHSARGMPRFGTEWF